MFNNSEPKIIEKKKKWETSPLIQYISIGTLSFLVSLAIISFTIITLANAAESSSNKVSEIAVEPETLLEIIATQTEAIARLETSLQPTEAVYIFAGAHTCRCIVEKIRSHNSKIQS